MEALTYIANDSIPPRTWGGLLSSLFHYTTLPLVIFLRTLTSILLTVFSPLLYLSAFFWRIGVYPFSLLYKLETLYIYLGTASFIGLLTGLLLYLSSSSLITLFSLDQPAPPLFGKSVYGAKAFSNWSSKSTLRLSDERLSEETERDESISWYSGSLRKRDVDVLNRAGGQRGLDGLRSQVILEEDSDGSHL